jgi:hypothetical protein
MTAPYTDPDGFPSWQQSPIIREMDASARRQTLAKETLRQLRNMIEGTQRTLEYLRTQEAINEARLAEEQERGKRITERYHADLKNRQF